MKYQRIEKEINNIVINANQVSNSVLEKTRKAMEENQNQPRPKKSPVFQKVLKPAILVPILTVLTLCMISISLAIIENDRYNYMNKNNNSYTYSELQKETISSIEQYNLDNHTEYYYFKDLTVLSSFELMHSSTSVGFEETYQYKEYTISMYFHFSSAKYDVDDDYLRDQRKYFENIKYCYSANNAILQVYILQEPMEYFITIDSDNQNLIEEVLPYFIKSQS